MKSLVRFVSVGLALAAVASVCLVSQEADAGRCTGPVALHSSVNADSSDTYRDVTFCPGQYRFEVVGDGDTDLDCLVSENGVVVARDVDDTDHCIVDFTVRRMVNLNLMILNNGSVYNAYDMFVR